MLLSLTTFNVCPELRPLCSTGIARLRRSYWPLGQVSQQFSVSPGLSSTNRFAGNTKELLLATMRTPSKLWRVVVRRLGCCSHPCRRFPATGCPLLTESKCNGDGQLLAGSGGCPFSSKADLGKNGFLRMAGYGRAPPRDDDGFKSSSRAQTFHQTP